MRGSLRFVPLGLKIVLPIVTVVVSIGVAQMLIATKPALSEQTVTMEAPPVSAVRVGKLAVCFPIRSQGTVQPRTESTLIARVPGRIVSVAECFDESGFFGKGEVLVQIDRRDYEVRIRRFEAAERAVSAERLEAEQQLGRMKKLQDRTTVSLAEMDQLQTVFDMATARADELEAQLAEARNALTDTEIVAPFDGCIREKHADMGQYVTQGTPLATCFATDVVEVRLPVTDQDFAFIDLPLGKTVEPGAGPDVVLEAHFAGQLCRWTGMIVRSEAIVDSRSRMVYLVANVPSPYATTDRSGGQPLAVGMFIEATIRSTPIADAVVLPESCVTGDGRLFVILEGGNLESREVEVLRRERNWVIVRGDVVDDERVCATRLEHPISGMQVEVVEDFVFELPGIVGDGPAFLSADTTPALKRLDEQAMKE